MFGFSERMPLEKRGQLEASYRLADGKSNNKGHKWQLPNMSLVNRAACGQHSS